MRFYFDPKKSDVLQQLSIHMTNAQFNYRFAYLVVNVLATEFKFKKL